MKSQTRYIFWDKRKMFDKQLFGKQQFDKQFHDKLNKFNKHYSVKASAKKLKK